jgi:hypothetical protein
MMYVILLLQFPALFLGIGSLGYAWLKRESPRNTSAWVLPGVAMAFGALVIVVGLVGWQMGLAEMQAALAGAIDDDQIRAMKREGERMASYPAIYGSIIGAPTLVAGVMAAFMVWRRPSE